MKTKYLLLLFFVPIILSCQNKFTAEDQLWDCMISEYDELAIDIEEEIALYEQFLVSENYLENNSGGSYIKLFEGFTEIGEIVPPVQNERYTTILQKFMNKGYRTECADTTLFKKTRIFDMQQRAKKVMETAGDIEPNLLSTTILSVYSEEDLEHPLYRYTILSFLQAFMDRDIGISRQLPPIDESPTEILSDRNRIDIELNDKDELSFEGKPMELKNLRSTLIRYLKSDGSNSEYPERTTYKTTVLGEVTSTKAVISVKNNRMTTYKMYIAVQNEISAAYSQIRDEKAMQYYAMPYDSLSEERQLKIREIVPMKISEAVPE